MGTTKEMKVLVLEDNPYRATQFKVAYPDADIVATAVEACDRLISNVNYDLIFIDHDLTKEHYDCYNAFADYPNIYACEIRKLQDTGYYFAQRLDMFPNLSPKAKIICHSINSIGAKHICDVLKSRHARSIVFDTLTRDGHRFPTEEDLPNI